MKKIFFTILAMSVVAACGGGQPQGQADVRIAVPAAFVSQDSIDRIVLRVSGPDLPNYIQQVIRPPFTDSSAFDVTFPFGKTRIFEVFAPFRGTDNRMLYGRQVYPVLEEDVASADVLNLPTFPLNFTNFAEDATVTDVVSTDISQPDIQSFHVYRVAPGIDALCSGAVVFEVGYNPAFVSPTATSINSLRTLVELDTDDNPDTGSATSRIEQFSGALDNAFTQGTDLLLLSYTRTSVAFSTDFLPRPTAIGEVFDVSGATDINRPEINPFVTYNPRTTTLYVCIPSDSFDVIDPDGVGRVNVLSGIDRGPDVVDPFTGNDILFRSGYIRYDLNLDTSTIPGAEGSGI